MQPCIAALDQGTQSTRVFIFDAQARPLACYQEALPQILPQAGWCEHDPMVIWASVQSCIAGALQAAEAAVGPVRVVGLGITNQRETTVVWDRDSGLPLHNAIVWLDNRTSAICARWREQLPGGRDALRPVTGLPISTYFSCFKFEWLRVNVAAVRDAAAAGRCMVGTVDAWLMYRLTGGPQGGVHVTDVTNASRTGLMDLATLDWHPPFLDLFGLTRDMLPRIASNAEVYGLVAEGPLAGVPIAGCLGDQMAAMLGQRCAAGEAKNTYGTGCFMLLATGPAPVPSTHGLLTTVAAKLGPEAPAHYALEGSVAVAGLGVSWLRDNLRAIDSADESESLARQVTDTGGVYFVPAFGGLLAPRWRDDARGVIVGLTGFTTRAHIARAMLEAICFQSREVLEAMAADARLGARPGVLRADGGASKNDLLMQLQADLLQVTVERPTFQETTALGAALAAGLTVGLWDADFVATPPPDHAARFVPAVTPEAAERRYTHWGVAVERALGLADLGTE